MKNIFITLFTLCLVNLCFAQRTVMVNKTTNALIYPTATQFTQANSLAPANKPYIYLDMSPNMVNYYMDIPNSNGLSNTNWAPFDFELKVVKNSTNNQTTELVYWLSSVGGHSYGYEYGHSSYSYHRARDKNAKVYVLIDNGQGRREWKQYPVDGTCSSIYAWAKRRAQNYSYSIGGIIIIPSDTTQDGTSTKNFFNPNYSNMNTYSVIYVRITGSNVETVNNDIYWRSPIILTGTGAETK